MHTLSHQDLVNVITLGLFNIFYFLLDKLILQLKYFEIIFQFLT